MKAFVLASALAALACPVFADEVVVPLPGVAVEHRAADDGATTEKTVRHNADGCTTKTMTKSNDAGDSVTKTKSDC